MTDTATSRSPRNPADLLGLGTHPALSRLLRACGADEACISGGASDYDKFLALAAALPFCEGHPLREAVNASLTTATEISVPLCPHTARAHWDAWVKRHWYGREEPPPIFPAACPFCASPAPTVLRADGLIRLPDPLAVKSTDLSAWSRELEATLPADGSIAAVVLPAGYAFTRPNPYHADLAVGKVLVGKELTQTEGALLVTQALRVWGLASVSRRITLLLRGGTPDAVLSLLGYLDASRALPATVWIPDDPVHAGAVSGLYRSVKTGMAVTSDVASPSFEAARASYAAVAPIGACVFVE